MKQAIGPLAFIFFLFVSISTSSQSLYEIKFTDKQNIQYSCLLVFFHETNAYMRISYNYNNTYNVVNVTYRMNNGTNSQGSRYSMLTGLNPVFITDNKAKLGYKPDYFIWFYNTSTQAWGTPYTTDDSLLSPASYRIVEYCRQLEPRTITDQYLRRFFGNKESQYFSLRRMCGLAPAPPSPVKKYKAASLHLVLVANTNDSRIGAGCAADERNLKNEFNQIANALGVSFREYIIHDDAFSRQKVLTTLSSLTPGANDIVVFIYRGHGFRWKDQTSDWPSLDLRSSSYDTISRSNTMYLTEVYNALQDKGARLNIILGDCCNSTINVSSVTNSNYLTFQVDNNADISKLRKLFMDSKGTILSAAARKGEVSWNTVQGGLYSISFLQALREEISYLNASSLSWDNLVTKTISLARTKSTRAFCSNCTLQNGIKYVSVASF